MGLTCNWALQLQLSSDNWQLSQFLLCSAMLTLLSDLFSMTSPVDLWFDPTFFIKPQFNFLNNYYSTSRHFDMWDIADITQLLILSQEFLELTLQDRKQVYSGC